MAADDGASVSAVAIRELAAVSKRVDNRALFGALPDLGVSNADILRALDADRLEP